MAIESANQILNELQVDDQLMFGTELSSTNAGALSVKVPVSIITTAGAETRTLANGREGQLKIVVCSTYVGDAVITPTNLANGTTITLNAAADSWVGVFYSGEWHTIASFGTTAVA